MKNMKLISLAAVAAMLLAVLVLYIVAGPVSIITRVLMGVLAVTLAAAGFLYRAELKALIFKPQALSGASRFIQIGVFAGVVVFLYLFADMLAWKADFTSAGLYRLSDETVRVMNSLTNKLDAYYFISPAMENSEIKPYVDYQHNLLKAYAEKNPRMKIHKIDPNAERALAIDYGVKEDGVVIFEYEGSRMMVDFRRMVEPAHDGSKVSYKGEAAFTGALKSLLLTKPKNIYVLSGHGEIRPDDRTSRGFKIIFDRLGQENTQVQALDLTKMPDIPANASLLILANPVKSYTLDEMDKIGTAMDHGGSVLVLLEFETHETINDTLRRMGLFYLPNLAVEDQDYNPQQGRATLEPQLIPHEITEVLLRGRIGMQMPTAAGIFELPEKDRIPGYLYQVKPLLKTSKKAYGEMSKKEILARQVEQHKNDISGPLQLAWAAVRMNTNAVEGEEEARMVVIGDTDFINNINADKYGNTDFFLNSVNFLLKREGEMSIRPKTSEITPFQLTSSERRLLGVMLIIIVLAWIVPGAIVVYRRGRRVKGS